MGFLILATSEQIVHSGLKDRGVFCKEWIGETQSYTGIICLLSWFEIEMPAANHIDYVAR